MDALRLLTYNHAQRRRFAEFFVKEVPWDVLAENHETSHQNIVNAFVHGCHMEDWWLHYVLPGRNWDGPAYDGFTDAASVHERVLEVEAKTKAWMAGLKVADLEADVTVEPAPGHATTLALGDLVVETVLEDIHHRGEVLAMLWRKDIAPPYESYMEWCAQGAD